MKHIKKQKRSHEPIIYNTLIIRLLQSKSISYQETFTYVFNHLLPRVNLQKLTGEIDGKSSQDVNKYSIFIHENCGLHDDEKKATRSSSGCDESDDEFNGECRDKQGYEGGSQSAGGGLMARTNGN